MRRLFAAAGVDYDQWKALTKAALKLDFRSTSTGRMPGGRGTSTFAVYAFQILFYTVLGGIMAFFVIASADLFFVGTVLATYTLFMVGSAVLLDHNSALTSPDDYPVLGFRPISSRTYFAARLANVLVYTTAITTVVLCLPLVVLFFRHGPGVGVAGVVAMYACSTSAALAILFGYAVLLRLVGPHALKRALSYVQLAMSFLVYGGYMFVAQGIAKAAAASFTLPKTWWVLLYPGTWFASYLEIAAGRTGATEIVPAAVSVVALAGMAASLGGRLSLDYSERLGAIMTASQPARRARATTSSRVWFRSGEARAMALLIRSQFKNDQRFRLSVLAILPLTLLYLYIGANDGGMTDPFVPVAGDQVRFSPVLFAVIMFPSMLRASLSRSDKFQASWIFFACPASRARLVRSAKNVLVAYFLIPYLLLVLVLFTWFIRNVWHVAVHVALLGLLSHLCLQFFVLLDPTLPFSQPPQKQRNSGMFIAFMMAMSAITVLLGALSAHLYASTTATIAAFAAVLSASVALDRLTRLRVERQTANLEFEG